MIYNTHCYAMLPAKKKPDFSFEVRGTSVEFQLSAKVTVDWGDGTVETRVFSSARKPRHAYRLAGTYIVSIEGNFNNFSFMDCKSLTRVLQPFPKSAGLRAREAYRLFAGCSSLYEIPGDLFVNCPDFTDFSGCFYGTGLKSIPEGLFKSCSRAEVFEDCFGECASLREIPEDLFSNCPAVTTFGYCFTGDLALTGIPEGLFRNCGAVEYFTYCFAYCEAVTVIPEKLFSNCTEVIGFDCCFLECIALTAIPAGLFDNCPYVEYFEQTFDGDTALTGEAPALWELYPDASGDYCFGECTGLSNYEEIPRSWGGLKRS